MELNRGLCSILLTSLHTVQTLQTETLSFVLSSSIFLSRLSPTVRLRPTMKRIILITIIKIFARSKQIIRG